MIKSQQAVTSPETIPPELPKKVRGATPPSIPNVDEFSTARVLPGWQKNPKYLRDVFTGEGGVVAQLALGRALSCGLKDLDGRQILMATYENPWGKGGGLFQIACKLPDEFNRLSIGELTRAVPDRMYRLSPLHGNVSTSLPKKLLQTARAAHTSKNSDGVLPDLDCPMKDTPWTVTQVDADNRPVAEVCYLGSCKVPFGTPKVDGKRTLYTTHIYRVHDHEGGGDWILFGNECFFQGDRSPYEYHSIPKGREHVTDQLRHDALFASKAAPVVAAKLGMSSPLFQAQDWQFASVALTAKEACLEGVLPQASVVLTMHNVYDQALPASELLKITDRVEDHRWPKISGNGTRDTLLTRMIPLLDAPPSAVSADLIHDILNIPACFKASEELVAILKEFRGIGIFNGTYVAAPNTQSVRSAVLKARQGDVGPIVELKRAQRQNMLTHFSRFLNEQRNQSAAKGESPIIGRLREEDQGGLQHLKSEVPVFFTMGRFDPDQKGQDLFLESISRLSKDTDARFIVGAAGISTKQFPLFYARAQEIVEKSDGRAIVVSTFFTGEVRDNLQKGPDFLVMSSLYEPTGMVTEFNTQLTPVIAHATGGLRRLVSHFDSKTLTGSGLHFGVDGEYRPEANSDWGRIRGEYDPVKRRGVRLYSALADELAHTLDYATEMFATRPEHYGRMLANLPSQVTKFAWGPSIYQYWDLFDKACSN